MPRPRKNSNSNMQQPSSGRGWRGVRAVRQRSSPMVVGAASTSTRRAVPPPVVPQGGTSRYKFYMSKIRLNTDENPKRSTQARERFDLYRNGMTIAEYLDAGGRTTDLWWDKGHGYIDILQ